jgi:ketosteroid isomerase-like protein
MNSAELLMKTVIEAWGNADMRPALEALDENVVWKSASSSEGGVFRFGGTYRGKRSVLSLLSTLSANYFFEHYSAKEIVSKEEVVWGLFDVQGSYRRFEGHDKPDRKQINLEVAFRWRIRDDKILEAQSFFDTAALLVQQHELSAGAA